MLEAVAADVEVALPAIGVHLGTAGDVVEHEVSQGRLGHVGDAPHAHPPGRRAAILDGDRDDRLAGHATARGAGTTRADVALIDLDRAREQLAPRRSTIARAQLM